MVRCWQQPLLLQCLLISIAVSGSDSVTTSPAFNLGLQRRATVNFMGVLGPASPAHFQRTLLVNGISLGPTWETYLFWPHIAYPFQHPHLLGSFIPSSFYTLAIQAFQIGLCEAHCFFHVSRSHPHGKFSAYTRVLAWMLNSLVLREWPSSL